MNPIGVHGSVWTGDWTADEVGRAAHETAAAGYDLLEVPVSDPASVDATMTRRMLDDAGLSATCSLGLRPGADISSTDQDEAAAGERLLIDALHVAVDLGSNYLGGVLFSAMTKYDRPATPAGRANAVAALARLAAKAADDGVILGLEVVNRYESNLVNTGRQAVALIEEIGADNVVVHLDSYHMNIEEGDLARPVVECAELLGYVHVGESHRGYLGSGTVDFPRFFRALVDIGYTGPITFESFSSTVISPTLSNTLGVWRNLWHDGADLARHAHGFIVGGMTAARRT